MNCAVLRLGTWEGEKWGQVGDLGHRSVVSEELSLMFVRVLGAIAKPLPAACNVQAH